MKIVDQLKDQAEDLGYKVGSVEYEKELRKLKVFKCQDIRGFNECRPCVVFHSCELLREYKMDLYYPDRVKAKVVE